MNGMNEYTVYLALGSNLGDKQKNIDEALDKIEERIGKITSLSAFYLTSPVGFQSESIFVNGVCEVSTHINIYELFAITRDIEKEIGRCHKSKNGRYADRIIDIDLILAGNLVIDTPELTVPHPRFHTRSFVLDPLREIAPDLIHPLLGKPIRQLWEELHRGQFGH
ncbi:2-amino-4-hydroxy-6-hydroxymethyldihydropteridine diphosphokinase [Proteiniphilum sp. X52]|uniref:2-amino-4-hydroxy-6- hydroxymethyldihydropteridine diphosphokinase n=1 Tax=Proteiniphilum sp. X52 TaxID=2382159 RepID=UPI000F0A3C6F|nr:2-amino-4-hydroxy-6-hydroxymethyldihydropteridine diphosphokinase [Proteiniphilum sp. X52]RNC64512.1 2-amino-4-hydroxy-6-hydroxymethyldihydropteridine diphosphokinase [Proteiniphilum sp. X52]